MGVIVDGSENEKNKIEGSATWQHVVMFGIMVAGIVAICYILSTSN